MRIYVDLDDILCETARALSELSLRRFGHARPYEDIREFDLQVTFGLSDDEMREFRRLSHSPDVLSSYPVTPGAPESLRLLRAAGHDVEIATGRPARAHAGTRDWLAAAGLTDFPVFYVDKYGRTADFPAQAGDPPTWSMEAMRARGYDVAVDDSPMALNVLATWSHTRVFVFDRPWNRAYRLAANMTRFSGWSDFPIHRLI